MFPYLDLATVKRRSILRSTYFTDVESLEPGFTVQTIASHSSSINARLRKRYSRGLPWGSKPPILVAAGLTPPPATLTGIGTLGALLIKAQITTGGALGTALYQWSSDGGSTWNIASALVAVGTSPPAVTVSGLSTLALPSLLVIQVTTGGALGTAVVKYSLDGGVTFTTNVTTAASLALGASGLVATFPVGTYATDNVYTAQGLPTAATLLLGTTGLTLNLPAETYDTTDVYSAAPPVPEAILRWLTTLVTWDVLRKHGAPRTGDDLATGLVTEVELVQKQIEDAANTQTGLWDLPASEDECSAISSGGPRSHSEASPYEWAYRQQLRAERGGFDFVDVPNRLIGR